MDNQRTALITGGTRGIGLGIAQALAREGWNLALNGRRLLADVEDVMAELATDGNQVTYHPADLSDAPAREGLIQSVVQAHGRLDLLVNNAGIAPKQRVDLLETTVESFEEVITINLMAPYFLAQAAARQFLQQEPGPLGKGMIVNINSISATVASVSRGEYCVAKAGLAMTTQLFAVRLGAEDIPVYEIRPGVTETDMTAGVKEKYDRLIADGLCVQPRWGQPSDIGKAVAALARGDFPYSTGQAITVDGGLTLSRL